MRIIWTLATIAGTIHATAQLQTPLQLPSHDESPPKTNRIAIIGAGIAGATLAFQLQKVHGHRAPFEIVVFEQSSTIGGLVNATLIDDDLYAAYTGVVDTGGYAFRQDDLCIQMAIDDVGLRRDVIDIPDHHNRGRYSRGYDRVGVWEHNRLLFQRTRDLKPRSRSEYLRDLWTYGLSVPRLQTLLQDKLSRFRSLYQEFQYPNLNLTDAVRQVGLLEESKSAADEYLLKAGISRAYLYDIVNPTVRMLFGRNLSDLNALSALVAMDSAPSFRIEGFSSRTNELVDRLLRISQAEVKLNTRVTSIKKSVEGKFLLQTSETNKSTSPNEQYEEYESKDSFYKAFDAVIIASHLQKAKLDFDMHINTDISLQPNLTSTHVTHFTTPSHVQLSPAYFNLTNVRDIPNILYTTSTQPHVLSLENAPVMTSRGLCEPVYENLVKITSTRAVPDTAIAELLGHVPHTPLDETQVRWVHRQAWPECMVDKVRGPQIDDMMLAPKLFYTGVASELVPTMEMSCRVGRQVAYEVFLQMQAYQEGEREELV